VGVSIFYLNRKGHVVAFNPKKLILDKHITFLLFKIGFPTIIQQSLISISGMFVQTFVNSFGAAAANAYGAVLTVDMFAFMPAMSMSMAVATLTGQNLGAGRPERVKRIFKSGVMMTSSITILISIIVVTLSRLILLMFGLGDDARVMDIGMSYLRIAGSCYIFFAIMFISNGVITVRAIPSSPWFLHSCRSGSSGYLWHGFSQKQTSGLPGYGSPSRSVFS
jgi:Na+-driven multidrug efflux pump